MYYSGGCSSNAIIALSSRQILVIGQVVVEFAVDGNGDGAELEGDLGALRVAAGALPNAAPIMSPPADSVTGTAARRVGRSAR